jgi:hypothetical protein
MSRKRKIYYDDSALEYQLKYFKTLSEKQRRHFLAFEYLKLGVGSQRYLADVFGCARRIIVDGVKEVQSPDFVPDYARQRSIGAGRKKKKFPSLTCQD